MLSYDAIWKHCFENICDVMSITDFDAQKISALCCSLVNVNLVIELDLFSSVLLAAATDSSSFYLHANGSSFCVDVEAFWSSFFKNPHTDVFFPLVFTAF